MQNTGDKQPQNKNRKYIQIRTNRTRVNLTEEMERDEEMKGNTNEANKAAIMHTVNRTQI